MKYIQRRYSLVTWQISMHFNLTGPQRGRPVIAWLLYGHHLCIRYVGVCSCQTLFMSVKVRHEWSFTAAYVIYVCPDDIVHCVYFIVWKYCATWSDSTVVTTNNTYNNIIWYNIYIYIWYQLFILPCTTTTKKLAVIGFSMLVNADDVNISGRYRVIAEGTCWHWVDIVASGWCMVGVWLASSWHPLGNRSILGNFTIIGKLSAWYRLRSRWLPTTSGTWVYSCNLSKDNLMRIFCVWPPRPMEYILLQGHHNTLS